MDHILQLGDHGHAQQQIRSGDPGLAAADDLLNTARTDFDAAALAEQIGHLGKAAAALDHAADPNAGGAALAQHILHVLPQMGHIDFYTGELTLHTMNPFPAIALSPLYHSQRQDATEFCFFYIKKPSRREGFLGKDTYAFLRKRTPRQLGPQWLVMVQPALVSMTSSKGCSSRTNAMALSTTAWSMGE